MSKTLIKIIAIDLAGLAGFALLVMFPNAIGGIIVVGLGLAFVLLIVNVGFARWTWKDTASVVGPPLVLEALRRAKRGEL